MDIGGRPPMTTGSIQPVAQPSPWLGRGGSSSMPQGPGLPPAMANVNQGMPPQGMPPMAMPQLPMQAPMAQQLTRALAPQMQNRFSRQF